MARRVVHYSASQHLPIGDKMVCNRKRGPRTIVTNNTSLVSCKTCLKNMERAGIIEPSAESVVLSQVGDISIDSGDKRHDEWLTRMGIK